MNEKQAINGDLIPVDEVVKLLPFGKSTFLNGVKSGKFPQPLRLTPRRPLWRKSVIESLLAAL